MSLVTTLGLMQKLSQTILTPCPLRLGGKSFCHYRNVIVHMYGRKALRPYLGVK